MILNIKQAIRSQIPAIVSTVRSSDMTRRSALLDESFFEQRISDAPVTAVITSDKIVRGVCVCEKLPIPDSCEITAIYIADGFKRIGFGRKLLSHALRELRAQFYRSAFIWLDENQFNAALFARKIGFAPDGKRRKSPYGDSFELRYRIDF